VELRRLLTYMFHFHYRVLQRLSCYGGWSCQFVIIGTTVWLLLLLLLLLWELLAVAISFLLKRFRNCVVFIYRHCLKGADGAGLGGPNVPRLIHERGSSDYFDVTVG
jgi:hypothetical protein